MNPVKSIRNSFYSTAFTLAAGIGALTSLSGCGGGEDDPQPVTPAKTELKGSVVNGFIIGTFAETVTDAATMIKDENGNVYTVSVGTRDQDVGDNATLTFSEVDITTPNSTIVTMEDESIVGMKGNKAFVGTITFNSKAKPEHSLNLKLVQFLVSEKDVAGIYPSDDASQVTYLKNHPEEFKGILRGAMVGFNDARPDQSGLQPRSVFVNVTAPK